jgi:hypothetical protein
MAADFEQIERQSQERTAAVGKPHTELDAVAGTLAKTKGSLHDRQRSEATTRRPRKVETQLSN